MENRHSQAIPADILGQIQARINEAHELLTPL